MNRGFLLVAFWIVVARAGFAAPQTIEFSSPSQAASEDAGALTATVELDQIVGSNVEATLALSGSASDVDDYTISPNPVVIPSGSTSADVTITLVDDLLFENDETIVLTLTSPVNASIGATAAHTVTVQNDDNPPVVNFQGLRSQAKEDGGSYALTVRLNRPSGLDVEVPFTSIGRARLGFDYSLSSSPLTIPAGSTTGDIIVTMVNDLTRENPERLRVTLQAPTNATLGLLNRHTMQIDDDDQPTTGTAVQGVAVDVSEIQFPEFLRAGETSSAVRIFLNNTNFVPVNVHRLFFQGPGRAHFVATPGSALPVTLQPGERLTVDVTFEPLAGGSWNGKLVVGQSPRGVPVTEVAVSGSSYGATGQELLLHTGQGKFVDSESDEWVSDFNSVGATDIAVPNTSDILGTEDDFLYLQSRRGADFSYAFELPNGAYEVTLHFAEPNKAAPLQRLFDVLVEGALEIDDLDLFEVAGRHVAHEIPILTEVTDGTLDLRFIGSVSNAVVAALEIRSVPVIDISPALLDFATVDQGQFVDLTVTLTNSGLFEAQIDSVSMASTQGSGIDFSIDIDGTSYSGNDKSVSHSIDTTIPAGGQAQFDVTFAPTYHDDHFVLLRFDGNFPMLETSVQGTGGANPSWGFLHPVLDSLPELIVDYDGNGIETVNLLGAESHTHEPGQLLVGYEWKLGQTVIGTLPDTRRNLPIGTNSISLTITDDNVPANTATDVRDYVVHTADAVPGVLTTYFDGGGNPVALLDGNPGTAVFIERRDGVQLFENSGLVGGSPYAGDVMVRLEAIFDAPQAATYDFTVSGGVDHRIEVDGNPVAGPIALSAGLHDLEVRVAIVGMGDLPVGLSVDIDGMTDSGFDADLVHDEQGIVPVIHDMPTIGNDIGGNLITISGFGFYPETQVTVHWGTQDFDFNDFVTYSADQIELTSPPGTGQLLVTVETPAGTSAPITYTYSPTGPVPIDFDRLDANAVSASGVTTGEWGPDGRFYVGLISGEIKAITFDENYAATDVQTYVGVSNLTNHDVLGVTFNPWDAPSPVKIYVAHGEHFLNGGGAFSGPSPYTGQVSVLTGPNFDTPVPLIEKLPTSNHDHSVNGMVFDHNGDLLVCVGGNTNAGVKWPLIGDLPESPYAGAIIKALTSKPGFNGDINYIDRITSAVANDQVFGEDVDVAPGSDIELHAVGLRNPYDLALTTWGYIYATDNGPNNNFGPASTSATTQGSQPSTSDELLLIEYDHYYGHANRSRGFYDDRQNVYYGVTQPDIPGVFTQRIWDVASSTNGIAEYRATTFNSQIRGELIVQKWNFRQRRLKLSDDKRSVVEQNDVFPQAVGLDATVGPGGAILAMNYSGNKVEILVPNDVSIVSLKALDIFPWRAPSTGGTPFVIGGENFGTLQDTSVTFDGIPATLTEVSSKRIKGVTPANPGGQSDLVDVVVTVGQNVSTLGEAFKFLAPAPGGGTGFWTSGASMPGPLGEVACAAIDGILYVAGEGNGTTYAYDILADSWIANAASRSLPGNHHGSEVVDGKWYLIGGLTSGNGAVQIYDPQLDSWSTGAPMSWSGGSVATAVIDGKIYAAGGIVGSSTVTNAAVYDPQLDSWTPLAPMPTGVNHAAAGTDGEKFYVFGGRGGGNTPQPGFDVVQVFDPVLGTWEASGQGGSTLAPMPSGRGGTGKAVFHRGQFFVFGGETNDANDQEATNQRVYPQVFVYDVASNAWRQDAPMPTPRHGMYPVKFAGRVFVVAGGTSFGFSSSAVMEILNF